MLIIFLECLWGSLFSQQGFWEQFSKLILKKVYQFLSKHVTESNRWCEWVFEISIGRYSVKVAVKTAWKVSKYGVLSVPYFPVFGLNTKIYFVNLRIQSEYRKTRTRNNSAFGHISRSEILGHLLLKNLETTLCLKEKRHKIKQ